MAEGSTRLIVLEANHSKIRISGSLDSHYSPKAKEILDVVADAGDGLIAPDQKPTRNGVIRLAETSSMDAYARVLYQALRCAAIIPLKNFIAILVVFKGTTVEQSFDLNLKNLIMVRFLVATYLQNNLHGSGNFQLLEASRTVLVSQNFQLLSLIDNSYISFYFETIHLTPGKEYFLTLSSNVQPTSGTFTLWSNQEFQNGSFVLRENGKLLKGSAIFDLTGS